MSSDHQSRKMAVLDQQDIPYRVRWYLLGAYRGGGRVKRIARDLNVSLRKAARLLAGENVTSSDLQAMAKRYGSSFIHFIFAPLAAGDSDAFAKEAAREKALDMATRGGPLAVVRDSVVDQPNMSASGAPLPGDRRDGGEVEEAGAEIKRAAE